jgi:GNAT superfamily N-acetyltransferase
MNSIHNENPGKKARFVIKEITDKERLRVSAFLINHWGSYEIVSRGHLHHANQLPGFFALSQGKILGLITYAQNGGECEIVSLNSGVEKVGIGTALLEAVRNEAKKNNCTRLWLITTNDNIPAIRFYQVRGFSLKAVYPKAIQESRKLKPSIPNLGLYGIPIRDELEFEMFI